MDEKAGKDVHEKERKALIFLTSLLYAVQNKQARAYITKKERERERNIMHVEASLLGNKAGRVYSKGRKLVVGW